MTFFIDQDLLEKIIHSLEHKADYIDIRAGESNSTSIIMKDSKMKDIKSGADFGCSVRVLKDGAWGFAFTSQISKLEDMAGEAFKLASSLKSDVSLAKIENIKDKVKSNAKIKPSTVSMDDKKDLITEIDAATNIDKVVSTNVSYVDMEGRSLFLNSEGSSIQVEDARVAIFLNAVASSGDNMQFGHGSIGGACGFEALKKEDTEKFGRRVAQKAVRLLDAKSAPSGKFTVIMDPELTGVFIHEAVGHASEADLILQNDSILKGKIGETIGSPLVNIVDDGSMDAFGYYAYDAEGVKTRANQLIKNGKLVSVISSRETASKLNIEPSGNSRSSISDQPIVRMSNTYLKSGNLEFEELIEDIENGIYLKGSRGGQVDTGKGIFQFNAAESFNIQKGEVKEPLRDVSLSGNILEILKKVDGVGSDFKMSLGFCGKSGQTAPVGDGGPHVRVIEATVGGMQ